MSGKVAGYVTYDDWGAPTMKAVLKLGLRELDLVTEYTGHPWDPVLGAYYARARMYDAADRRFMAEDLVGINLANTVSYNSYAYVWNNPVRLVDMLGLAPEPKWVECASIDVERGSCLGSIPIVWEKDTVTYVDFFQALKAYSVSWTVINSDTIYISSESSRTYGAWISISNKRISYVIVPADPVSPNVIGENYRIQVDSPPVVLVYNLVTLGYFQKLMCDLGIVASTKLNRGNVGTLTVEQVQRVFEKRATVTMVDQLNRALKKYGIQDKTL